MNCLETFIIWQLVYLRTPKTKNLIPPNHIFFILRFLLSTRESRQWSVQTNTRFAVRAIRWFRNDRLCQVLYFLAYLLALPADLFGALDKVCITKAFLLPLLFNLLIAYHVLLLRKDIFTIAFHVLLLILCPNHAIMSHTQYFLFCTFS